MPPVTVAEFTLSGLNGNIDFYDGKVALFAVKPALILGRTLVSLVDGYNLPLRIINNQGCGVADCPVDLGPNCTLTL